MPSVYRIAKNQKEVEDVIRYCEKTGYASIDFETSGEPFHSAGSYPTILGVTYQPGSSIIIPLGHFDSPFKKNFEKILLHFGKNVIENPDITKIAWNMQFEYNWFNKYDIDMIGRIDDGMLAKYILDEERPNGLKDMVSRFLPEFSGYDLPNQPSPKAGVNAIHKFWSNVPLKELSKYCGLDCDLTMRLMLFFYDKMTKHGFYKLYRNMLMMGVRVLADSKYRGIDIDKDYLYELDKKYIKKIERSEKKMRLLPRMVKFEKDLINSRIEKAVSIKEGEIIDIRDEIKIEKKRLKKGKISDNDFVKFKKSKNRLIETRENSIDKLYARELTSKKDLKLIEPINFKSPPQMAELFYHSKKGFKFKPFNFTDAGNPSTDEDTLLILKKKDKSGFIERLLDHRGLTKLYSTYIRGIIERLSENKRIHANFNLHTTVTGRLCVSKNTLIETTEGLIPIGKLIPEKEGIIKIDKKRDLRALTHLNNYKKITYAINKGYEKMYRVTLESGETIECTLGHKFLTPQGWNSLKEIYNTNGPIIIKS